MDLFKCIKSVWLRNVYRPSYILLQWNNIRNIDSLTIGVNGYLVQLCVCWGI